MKRTVILLISCLALCLAFSQIKAAKVGQKIDSLQLLKLKNEKWVKGWIPYIGKKVVSIMYTDVDEKDINDPLSDAIMKKNYPAEKYAGIGIGNSKDAPFKPDVFIRIAAKNKQKKYPGSIILLDEDRTFSLRLDLGNCNGKSVIMIIDKRGIIRYIKRISNKEQARAIIPEVLKLIDQLII